MKAKLTPFGPMVTMDDEPEMDELEAVVAVRTLALNAIDNIADAMHWLGEIKELSGVHEREWGDIIHDLHKAAKKIEQYAADLEQEIRAECPASCHCLKGGCPKRGKG